MLVRGGWYEVGGNEMGGNEWKLLNKCWGYGVWNYELRIRLVDVFIVKLEYVLLRGDNEIGCFWYGCYFWKFLCWFFNDGWFIYWIDLLLGYVIWCDFLVCWK